jgi:hypothetical protein
VCKQLQLNGLSDSSFDNGARTLRFVAGVATGLVSEIVSLVAQYLRYLTIHHQLQSLCRVYRKKKCDDDYWPIEAKGTQEIP